MRNAVGVLFCCLLGSVGCYHATVSTGATPSTEVIEKPFASSWVYGLVPPNAIETMAKCPQGVAKVETKLSFVNQLVGALTFGIYTPMTIKVTCALKANTTSALRADISVPSGTGRDQVRDAFASAADQAARQRATVLVQMAP